MTRLSDPLLRLLGADPATFRPLYRTQKLLLQRTVRSMRMGRRASSALSPFALLCVFAGLYGFVGAMTLASAKSHLLGAVFSLFLGCAFLMLVVVTDNFDILINPREMLLLGACPQDGRSFLLAKLAALVHHLSTLAVLLFGFPGIAVAAAFSSLLAGACFWAGAAAASVSTLTFGLLFATAVVRLGGRNALNRLLPWVQGAFQIGYFIVLGGQRLTSQLTTSSPGALGVLPWALPPYWFVSLVELATAGASAPVLGRLALAVATPALLLAGATRWLGSGLREKLLEPEPQGTTRRAARRRPAIHGGGERARLFALLRVQLRADWRVRSEFLLLPLMGIFILVFYLRGFGPFHSIPMLDVYFYCWLLMMGTNVLTRSSQPASMWWILVSPVDRARFSLGTISLMRLFQLLPLFAALMVPLSRGGSPWPLRLALMAELLLLGDLLIVTGKGLFPGFPFSQSRSEEGVSSNRTALALVSALFSGAATGAVALSGIFGLPGALTAAAVFALLHLPAGMWARRKATAAAAGLEMA
ncbi:MAG TPA: hypothetical protein VF173_35545 [Thermoanaerobaculia bacterium]|nr:hypothetical protein [Thermoanaerobaculia bacterium]